MKHLIYQGKDYILARTWPLYFELVDKQGKITKLPRSTPESEYQIYHHHLKPIPSAKPLPELLISGRLQAYRQERQQFLNELFTPKPKKQRKVGEPKEKKPRGTRTTRSSKAQKVLDSTLSDLAKLNPLLASALNSVLKS